MNWTTDDKGSDVYTPTEPEVIPTGCPAGEPQIKCAKCGQAQAAPVYDTDRCWYCGKELP